MRSQVDLFVGEKMGCSYVFGIGACFVFVGVVLMRSLFFMPSRFLPLPFV
jgi:hypothetical protein